MKSAVCLTSSARKFIFIMWGIAILSFHLLQTPLHCALSLAAQCIVIGPVCLCVRLCVCGLVYLFVCGSVTTITRNWCIDLHKTGLVGSDRLQLIKFWPSRAPGKGSAAERNFWLRLTTASTQCLRLTDRFFIIVCYCIFLLNYHCVHMFLLKL